MGPRWGWFSLWFFKRSEVISFLVACVLQYLSAVEVNKGRKDGMGWFKLGRFSPLLNFARSSTQRGDLLLSPRF